MLLTATQVRVVYAHCLVPDTKLPGKGKVLYLSSPYAPAGVGIWWTDRKSTYGKRLFNCGDVRPNGEQPPLFTA